MRFGSRSAPSVPKIRKLRPTSSEASSVLAAPCRMVWVSADSRSGRPDQADSSLRRVAARDQETNGTAEGSRYNLRARQRTPETHWYEPKRVDRRSLGGTGSRSVERGPGDLPRAHDSGRDGEGHGRWLLLDLVR